MQNRRTVLAAGIAAISLTSAGRALAQTSGPAAKDAAALAQVRLGWRRMLTGVARTSDPAPHSAAPLAGIVSAIDQETTRLLAHIDVGGASGGVWPDLIGGDERRTTSTLQRLRLMSIAHETPGSLHFASPPLAAAISAALGWIAEARYFPGAEKRGNWWDWEIGTPLRLLDVLILMSAHLPDDLTNRLLRTVDHFTPTAGLMHQTGVARPATGANLAWISCVRAGRCLLSDDAAGLQAARDTILPALTYVTTGDGFYADGSFIQHGDIASSGAYGAAFSFLVADFMTLLAGSPWALQPQDWAQMGQWIETGVLPLMHRGACMDMVRSRSISRADVQDQETGLIFQLALCRLSELATGEQADRLRTFVKNTIETDTALSLFDIDIDAPGFQMTLDHARVAARLMADPATPLTNPAPGHFQFANMDRVVHRRPAFTLGIAMYSDRVGNFEAINGQNKHGWYTGHGMTYVYDDRLEHYRDGFWPTVDPLRLPGVTSDGRPTTHQTRSPEAWVGGASLGEHGVIGMKANFNQGPTQANKSWFCFGDRVICLGGQIRGHGGVRLETTLENRRLVGGLRTEALSVDGAAVEAIARPVDVSSGSWLHLPEVGGLLLGIEAGRPHGMKVQGLLESRSGSWRAIDELNADDTPFSRDFATVWVDHGVDPDDGFYAYVTLPGATAEETERHARDSRLRVLARNAEAHAVADPDQGLFAANIWAEQGAEVGPVCTRNPCAVIVHQAPGKLVIGISDPTHRQQILQATVSAKAARLIRADARAQVQITGDAAVITINAAAAAGGSTLVELALEAS